MGIFKLNKLEKNRIYFLAVVMLLGFLPSFLLAQTNPQGFFLDSWLPKSIEINTFDTISQTTQSETVIVTIETDSILGKISKYVYGHNAAAWGGKIEQSTPLVNDIKALGANVIRWPGGSMSDDYFWNATNKATCPPDLPPTYEYKDLLYGANKTSWTMPVDSYYELLKKTNSTGIICVNYAYARIGTGDNPVLSAAKLAADWVRYDNGRTRYWEIGNENFGSWEMGYEIDTKLNKDGQPKTISGDLYGKHCKVFIEEMRKAAREVGNDIKIGVVAMDSHVTYNVVQRDWNKGMMPYMAGVADYIIVHNYYTPYSENSTVATILNSSSHTKDFKQYINTGLKTHADHDPMPIALTEWNIFAEGSKQQVSYVNGMHAALILGESMKNQLGLACRWDFLNGWGDGNSHGLFADGEPGITRYTPRAPFFYMYYFQKFFGDKFVHSSSTSTDVVSYASKFTSGQTGIVLVNKGAADQVVSIELNDFSEGNRYYYYLLTGGTDNGDFSRKVYVNGITSINEGGGPARYDTIRPYSSIIDGDIKFNLPKLSTIYLLAENDSGLLEQTISFDSIDIKRIGDEDFIITATTSSGLPVQFASSDFGVAKVNQDTVHIIGAGTCDIIAYQEGDSVYKPSFHTFRTLVVQKGEQIISMDSLEHAFFGESGILINASSNSGLPLQFTSSDPGIAIFKDGAVQITGSGTCNITAFQKGNSDFNAALPVSRTLTVLKAKQSIAFAAFDPKTTDEPDFSAGAVASSGLVCEYSGSDNEVASIVNNQIHINGSGTCIITATQPGNANYNPAPDVSRELIVTDVSGLETISGQKVFELFPNPAKSFVRVSLIPGKHVITIYNSLGAEVYSRSNIDTELIIPASDIGKAGFYFIKVNSTIQKFFLVN